MHSGSSCSGCSSCRGTRREGRRRNRRGPNGSSRGLGCRRKTGSRRKKVGKGRVWLAGSGPQAAKRRCVQGWEMGLWCT
jgi:hypothetical protein